MVQAMLSSALTTPHLVFALAGDHNEVPYGVLLGLAIIAALEIAAGLWMIHLGETRQHRRR